MKLRFTILILLLAGFLGFSQKHYHVFPDDHKKTPGKSTGNGSITNPWDLETALTQAIAVKGGDTIWIHNGVYKGRFVSAIAGTAEKPVVVLPYKNEKVILDGNVDDQLIAVLKVMGGHVEFRDLEITFLGNFSRKEGEEGFEIVNGINHHSGECKFVNLKIHNNPGSGIGSWKNTGGSQIIGCRIFNNGYFTKVRGSGVGIYVQNLSERERLIENNFIFNNYYKGVEVWSASSGSKMSYIKNVTLRNNVIMNNGLPAGRHVDNVIIASGDAEGTNAPKNIKLLNNVLYHNTNFADNKNFGDGASLTLGYGGNSPLVGATIKNNVIVGKNNGLRILHAKDYTFEGNSVYSGYVVMYKSVLEHLNSKNWRMADNEFYTRRSYMFRIEKDKDYQIGVWKKEFGIDAGTWNYPKYFDLPELIHKSRVEGSNSKYRLALFKKDSDKVTVVFSSEETNGESQYKLRDIETGEVLSEGKLNADNTITFPMDERNGTNTYLNIYEVEFGSKKKSKRGFFKRIFGWLF